MSLLDKFEDKRRGVTRAQRHGTHGTSARDSITLLSAICFIGAAAFWIPIQWALASPEKWLSADALIAVMLGLFMVVGVPAVVSIFVPWTRVARTLARLNLTWFGQFVGIGMGGFLLWYAGSMMHTYWMARPIALASGSTYYQTVLGMICTIAVPAFLWAPGSPDDLADGMEADAKIRTWEQEVREAEQRGKARIAALRELETQAVLAVQQSLTDMTAQSRGELRTHLLGILTHVDGAVGDLYRHYVTSTKVTAKYQPLLANDDVHTQLDGIAGLLEEAHTDEVLEVAPPARAHAPATAPTARLRATVPQHNAETSDRTGAAARAPVGRHGPQTSDRAPAPPPASDDDIWFAEGALGTRVWKRADLEEALSIEKTKALMLIKDWLTAGHIVKLTEPRDHYQFAFNQSEAAND